MKLFLVFLPYFTIVMHCGYTQMPLKNTKIQIDSTVSIALTKTDIAILSGDESEYNKIATNFFQEGEPDSIFRNMILYSFVMAERYGNTYAAYNCFHLLRGYSDIPRDSSLTLLLLHLLEIGASADTSCADIPEIGCAFYLAKWYSGVKYIKPDPNKQQYYEEKGKAMARSRKRRIKKEIE